MLLVMALIYLLFSEQMHKDFYQQLHERTEFAAQVYLKADEISSKALAKIKKKFIISLPQELIQFYDSTGALAFIKEGGSNWRDAIIKKVREQKYIEYTQNGKQTVGIYYEDNQGNFVILAEAKDIHGKERQETLLGIMAVLFLVQILIQYIAGNWFAKNTLMPIQKINEQVQKISATDLHLRVTSNYENDEFGVLATNFNDLLTRLEHSFELQRKFVANASHELKTPITNMMGEIEVVLIRERDNEEYKNTLHSVLAEIEHLHSIIQNFLMLANEENDRTKQSAEPLRLDELLWELKESFALEAHHLLRIEMGDLPDDENALYIKGNKTLLLLAISNIIRNGFKFSDDKPLTCHLSAKDDNINLSISDNGIGMSPEIMKDIFEPFYRAPQAGNYPGHGMGLYITRKIITLFGGSITVQSEAGRGSTFNIYFTKTTQV
jgi:signal transduction histidine kinase